MSFISFLCCSSVRNKNERELAEDESKHTKECTLLFEILRLYVATLTHEKITACELKMTFHAFHTDVNNFHPAKGFFFLQNRTYLFFKRIVI